MHAVVSLLDHHYYERVENLWSELASKFGLQGIYRTPYPHFSYQVAAGYDVDKLSRALEEVASRTAPFRVSTAGIGLFTGSHPVLYLPVVRTPHLTGFHARLWKLLSPTATGVADYYRPEGWMPHITLAEHDLDPATAAQAVSFLTARDLYWEIFIDNVALIYDTGDRQELRLRFDFRG